MHDVLFLPVSGPRGASSRYRVFQFLPALSSKQLSHRVHLPPLPARSGLSRLRARLEERKRIAELGAEARAIFVQKRLLASSQIKSLASRRPLLFDFDDAIFTSPHGDRSLFAQYRVEARLKNSLAAARLVIAGNQFLADYALQYAQRVVVIPTVVDDTRYPPKIHEDKSDLVIGWIGHSVNFPYLARLIPALQSLGRIARFRLLVVADRDFPAAGIEVMNRRWSESSEIADIMSMDIGLMPLPDDTWSRGKCGLKAIQYMAAGIPVVCSASGANVDIVRHGTDGFCVRGNAEWIEAMHLLLRESATRLRMGKNGRRRVQDQYSLAAATPHWLAAIDELLGG